MTELDVVNACLSTIGQAPVNSLTGSGRWIGICKTLLDNTSRTVQARPRWFNYEALTLSPNPTDGRIYLPGDTVSVVVAPAFGVGRVVARGGVLYDLDSGNDVIAATLKVTITRVLPFDTLPELAQAFIHWRVVKLFQTQYDGDIAKSRQIDDELLRAQREFMAEDVRQAQVNMIDTSLSVQAVRRFGSYPVYGRS